MKSGGYEYSRSSDKASIRRSVGRRGLQGDVFRGVCLFLVVLCFLVVRCRSAVGLRRFEFRIQALKGFSKAFQRLAKAPASALVSHSLCRGQEDALLGRQELHGSQPEAGGKLAQISFCEDMRIHDPGLAPPPKVLWRWVL